MHRTSGNTSKYPAHKRRRSRCSLSEEPPNTTANGLPRLSSGFQTIGRKFSQIERSQPLDFEAANSPLFASEKSVVPGLRHTNLREVLQYVINDALKIGGRPESAVAQETDLGEIIEVQTKSPSGQAIIKHIEWQVDPDVPDTILSKFSVIVILGSC